MDTARERLAEALAGQVDVAELPAMTDRLVPRLEAKWSPAGEVLRMRQAILRLWERAGHPRVKVELAWAAETMRKLAEEAGEGAAGGRRRRAKI